MGENLTFSLTEQEAREIIELLVAENSAANQPLIDKLHQQLTAQGGSFAWTAAPGKVTA